MAILEPTQELLYQQDLAVLAKAQVIPSVEQHRTRTKLIPTPQRQIVERRSGHPQLPLALRQNV